MKPEIQDEETQMTKCEAGPFKEMLLTALKKWRPRTLLEWEGSGCSYCLRSMTIRGERCFLFGFRSRTGLKFTYGIIDVYQMVSACYVDSDSLDETSTEVAARLNEAREQLIREAPYDKA